MRFLLLASLALAAACNQNNDAATDTPSIAAQLSTAPHPMNTLAKTELDGWSRLWSTVQDAQGFESLIQTADGLATRLKATAAASRTANPDAWTTDWAATRDGLEAKWDADAQALTIKFPSAEWQELAKRTRDSSDDVAMWLNARVCDDVRCNSLRKWRHEEENGDTCLLLGAGVMTDLVKLTSIRSPDSRTTGFLRAQIIDDIVSATEPSDLCALRTSNTPAAAIGVSYDDLRRDVTQLASEEAVSESDRRRLEAWLENGPLANRS